MAHPFPQESVGLAQKRFDNYRGANPLAGKFEYAGGAMYFYSKAYYGFFQHLRLGNYAPWPHEAQFQNIPGDNCTTIIPRLYLDLEVYGIKPQIIQFVDFRRVEQNNKTKPLNEHHFALIADLGMERKYLIDPFWKTFGPILQLTRQRIRIGKTRGYEAETREFKTLLYYKPEEFAAMINRLKDPAESLDMLVAGQQVYDDKWIKSVKVSPTLMAYYHDDENELTTRLYVPQVGFPNKAVYCKMKLNDQGDVVQTRLQLVVAKDDYWQSLEEEKTIARTDFSTLRKIRSGVRTIKRKQDRLGPALSKQGNRRERESLLELVDQLWSNLSPEEQTALKPQVLGRTLYETAYPRRRYIYSQDERDSHLIALIKKYYPLKEKRAPWMKIDYFHSWKIRRVSKQRYRQVQRHLKRLNEQITKLDNAEAELRDLRYNDQPAYDRNRDKWLFNRSLGKPTVEKLERTVRWQNLDWRSGYLAMIEEYLPVIFSPETHLELNFCRASIKEKVAARRARKHALAQAA